VTEPQAQGKMMARRAYFHDSQIRKKIKKDKNMIDVQQLENNIGEATFARNSNAQRKETRTVPAVKSLNGSITVQRKHHGRRSGGTDSLLRANQVNKH